MLTRWLCPLALVAATLAGTRPRRAGTSFDSAAALQKSWDFEARRRLRRSGTRSGESRALDPASCSAAWPVRGIDRVQTALSSTRGPRGPVEPGLAYTNPTSWPTPSRLQARVRRAADNLQADISRRVSSVRPSSRRSPAEAPSRRRAPDDRPCHTDRDGVAEREDSRGQR